MKSKFCTRLGATMKIVRFDKLWDIGWQTRSDIKSSYEHSSNFDPRSVIKLHMFISTRACIRNSLRCPIFVAFRESQYCELEF